MDSDQNHPKQSKPAKEAELREITLAEICGVHSTILDLERELSLPPIGFPSKELTAEILQPALRAYPISVIKTKEKFTCVGNVRLYKVAASCLGPNEKIPVLVLRFRNSSNVIQASYLAELFSLSAVLAMGLGDKRRLYEVWEGNLDKQHFKTAFPLNSKTAFANVFRVSPRSLKNRETPKSE